MTKEIERKKFEVRFLQHKDGYQEKALFIDGIKIDYSIDISSFREAQKMGPAMTLEVKKDIAKHFTSCVSDVLGRNVTMEEIKKAIMTGWI